jgi:hypothetical protein
MKTAAAKLFTALLNLLAAALTLVTSLLVLIAALFTRGATALKATRAPATGSTATPVNTRVAAPALRLIQPTAIEPTSAPKPAPAPSNVERVAFALKGMGFKAPEVERALKNVPNVELLPVETAIKEALRCLARVA